MLYARRDSIYIYIYIYAPVRSIQTEQTKRYWNNLKLVALNYTKQ